MTTEEQKMSEVAAHAPHITQAARLGTQELAEGARHAFVRQRMEQRVKLPFNQLTALVGQADAIGLGASALRDTEELSKQDTPTDQHSAKEASEDCHDRRRRESA